MRLLQPVFGILAIAAGILLAVFAIVGFQMGDHVGAIVVGLISLIFIGGGLRWRRGYKRKSWQGATTRQKSWRDDPATYKQKSYADELGIRYPKNATKGELSDLISEVTGK